VASRVQVEREMRDETPAVKLSGLTKYYSTNSAGVTSSLNFRKFVNVLTGRRTNLFKALDDVSFEVRRGSIFGLLGPNGAGKTTLIKILSTLVLPDSGKALVNGVDVVKRPYRILRDLQTVLSEGFGFERRLTGRQNLEFYAALYGMSKEAARKRIDFLLDLVDIKEFSHLSYQRYSTGMARRLLISRALLSRASILLFDEPTSGMDPSTAIGFRKFITEKLRASEGRTIIITTHNIREAQQMCDHIGVINRGKLIALGTTDEVRNLVGETVNLSLTVSDTSSRSLVEEISKVQGVTHALLNGNGQPGEMLLSIDGHKELDYSTVFGILLNKHIKILSVQSSQPSLEDAFVYLTKSDA